MMDKHHREREKKDEARVRELLQDLSAIAMHRQRGKGNIDTTGQQVQRVLEQVFGCLGTAIPWNSDEQAPVESLDSFLDSAGILRREVELKGRWWKDAFGVMLVKNQAGDYMALRPKKTKGYQYFSCSDKKWHILTKDVADTCKTTALVFYRPLPPRKLTWKALAAFYRKDLTALRVLLFLLFVILAAVMAYLYPEVNELIITYILPLRDAAMLIPVAVVAVSAVLFSWLFQVLHQLISFQVETIMGTSFASALMGRMVYLPASFFSKWSAGDLGNRILGASKAISTIVSAVAQAGIAIITIGVGLTRIGHYAPDLMPVVCVYLAVMVVFLLWSGKAQQKYSYGILEKRAKLSSLVYALFSGITKIKTSGSEKRAFWRWGRQYANLAEKAYSPPFILMAQGELTVLLSMLATAAIYFLAPKSNIPVAGYLTFYATLGLVTAALGGLSVNILLMFQARPVFSLVTPILEAIPEMQGSKARIELEKCDIDITGLSFRYDEESSWVLQNLDLQIKSGDYVAIVGKSGCGKSTLIRLLLGFENPAMGTVSYNKQDIRHIDMHSLRQNIGCVLQNGALFQGSILQNILICVQGGTEEDAWDAARKANIAADIEQMPMKMHTMVSEGSQNISGGQKQRILIARAIASKPSVLLFDEATSALDNISQKAVTMAIEEIDCTRIVVAHRLSTIRSCNRIVVLDAGSVVEDGSFEELITQNGFFADLVKRQMEDLAAQV